MWLPSEICDEITRCVEYDEPAPRDVVNQRLKVLRLVDKQFCKSASAALFGTIDATLRDSQRYAEKPWPLTRLHDLANSPCAPLVKRITVGFSSFSPEHPKTHVYIQDLSALLPLCLTKFTNLIGLGVRGRTSSFYSPEDASGQIIYARLFSNAVASALRYAQLPYLDELSLALPVTHEFGQFADDQDTPLRVPLAGVLGRIRHLCLSVCDNSGHNGPVSRLKQKYPNAEHAARLFRCIEMAPQLKTLHIVASDVLNLDSFGWPSSLQLHTLFLHRVAISRERLVSLVGLSVVQAELTGIELNSGTWRVTLAQITQSPMLLRLRFRTCGYSSRWQASVEDELRPHALASYTHDQTRSPPRKSRPSWSQFPSGTVANHTLFGQDQEWRQPWPWFGSHWL